MNKQTSTKRLCRAGVISALYVALTYAFMPFAFGPFQIRPAEALCILPLFFPEAIPALCVGCAISNLTSPYALFDILFGTSATLLASLGTYFVGRFFKKDVVKLFVGGVFPVVCNAVIIPFVIVFLCGGSAGYTSTAIAYFTFFFSLFFTQSVWVYGLGTPLYFLVKRLRARRLPLFT